MFDYALDPEEIAAPSDDASRRDVWRVREITGRLAELQVEATLTPDGRWHETEAGGLWDDEAWLARAYYVLRRLPHESFALRHVLHT